MKKHTKKTRNLPGAAAGPDRGGIVSPLWRERFFELLFSHSPEALSLYNALNGSAYTEPEKLKILLLKDAVYLAVEDDSAFLIETSISLYEEQDPEPEQTATRFLRYWCDAMDAYFDTFAEDRFPVPQMISFYNGKRKWEDGPAAEYIYEYEGPPENAVPEMSLYILDITPGNNEEILNLCRPLREYVMFAQRVREKAEEVCILDRDNVGDVIQACMEDGILMDFLTAFRNASIRTVIYDYETAKEKHMKDKKLYFHGIADLMKQLTEEKHVSE